MIAVLETARHQVKIPSSFKSNAAMDLWIQENPMVAENNVFVYESNTKELLLKYKFGNLNATPIDAMLKITFIGKNSQSFPKGLPVRIQCADARYLYDYTVELPSKDAYGEQVLHIDMKKVPATYQAALTVTISSSSAKELDGGIQLEYYQYNAVYHGKEQQAVIKAPYDIISTKQELLAQKGSNSLLLIGSCTEISENALAMDLRAFGKRMK